MRVIHDSALPAWPQSAELEPYRDTKFLTAGIRIFYKPDTREPFVFPIYNIIPSVLVMPITSEGNIVLVQQWRQGIQDACWEFPGGHFDLHEEETLLARRELLQKTGYVAGQIEPVGRFHHNTSNSPSFFLGYIALDCHCCGLDAGEDIRVVEVSPSELTIMLLENRITDVATVCVAQQAFLRKFI